MTDRSSNRWLVSPPDPSAEVRVLCFNSAGAGGIAFERWNSPERALVQFMGVLLPGRELRFAETAIGDVDLLVEAMVRALLSVFDKPVALYGLSYGAVLAFELARALRRLGIPVHTLFAACRPAPQLKYPYEPVYDLPDDALIESIRSYGGLHVDEHVRPQTIKGFLPTVRADMRANTCYRYVDEEPLACPIVGLLGTEDPVCNHAQIAAWQVQTRQKLRIWSYSDGHFFHRTRFREVASRCCALLLPSMTCDPDEATNSRQV